MCCRVLQWRLLNNTSRAYFSEEGAFFHLEDQLGRSLSIFHHILHQANHFHDLQHSPSLRLCYFQCVSVVRVCSIFWRVRSSVLGSAFHLEDPLEEVYSACVSSTAISIQFLSCSCYSALLLHHFFHFVYFSQSF